MAGHIAYAMEWGISKHGPKNPAKISPGGGEQGGVKDQDHERRIWRRDWGE